MKTIYAEILSVAIVFCAIVGCDQEQSRFQIVSQYGKTLRIDKQTGKTHRFDNGVWVEVTEGGAAQATHYKSADEKIREAYEKMSDDALAQEIENLKGEESAAYVRYFNHKDEEALSDSVNAKQQIEMIKEIQRVRRAQKAASE